MSHFMIISIIKIFPPPGRGDAVMDVLASLKGPVSALPDCLGCSVSVEVGEGGAICYVERWSSREALDRHLNTPFYTRLLEVMECSSRSPEVEFIDVADVVGLELVEQVRKPT
ncbi:MAG: putative quinol monooxygenase [Desulfomicrobium sp.]